MPPVAFRPGNVTADGWTSARRTPAGLRQGRAGVIDGSPHSTKEGCAPPLSSDMIAVLNGYFCCCCAVAVSAFRSATIRS